MDLGGRSNSRKDEEEALLVRPGSGAPYLAISIIESLLQACLLVKNQVKLKLRCLSTCINMIFRNQGYLLSEGDDYIEKLVTITTSMYYETVKDVL